MNAIETLLDQPIFQALGWTLIHFIWQGALIAVLYLSVSMLLRRFTANVRYAAACGAMLLMLIAPAVTMLSIDSVPEHLPAAALIPEAPQSDQAGGANAQSAIDQLTLAGQTEIDPRSAAQQNTIKQWAQERLPRTIPWLLALWFAGVFFLSLRFAGGLVMVQRLKRTETSARVQLWQEKLASLSHRLRVSRPVRLCESVLVEVPTVIGWLRPVILLPASALTGLSTEQLEALLAHELAHIRRYDYLVNLLQTSIETLLFYHPAVWWVSAQARQEREHCCDDLAVAACGDVLTYARALTAVEQLRGCEVQLAVAANGGSLLVRIQRLLRGRAPAHYGFESGLAGFIALATVFILLAGAQTARLSRNAKAAALKNATVLTMSDSGPRATDQSADEVRPNGVDRQVVDPKATSSNDASPIDEQTSVQDPSSPAVIETASQDDKPSDSRGLSSEMAAVGLANLRDDEMIALKVNGITSQFVREMSALVSTKLTVDRIVAMRIHGVTQAFAEELKAQGLPSLSADQLIAFRIHGVTSQFVGELRNLGYGPVTPESLVAFRIHGVTPAMVQQMKDIGFENLSGDQLTALAIHGVTPLFAQTMKSFIRGKLTVNDLLGLSIHGVTAEMIKALEIMGYANLSASQLMALRIHEVTPGFIRSIQETGYDRITLEQLTELRISGVTPEFIHTVKSRGFTDVTPHQLAELRRLNILPSAKQN
jgi:beta-lactamase regulating signal transducer with metallopeptidase domain